MVSKEIVSLSKEVIQYSKTVLTGSTGVGVDKIRHNIMSIVVENYLFEYKHFRNKASVWVDINNLLEITDPKIVDDLIIILSIEELLFQIEHFEEDSKGGAEGLAIRMIIMGTFVASVLNSDGYKHTDELIETLGLFKKSLVSYSKDSKDSILASRKLFYSGHSFSLSNQNPGQEDFIKLEGDFKSKENAFWVIVNSSFDETLSGGNSKILKEHGLMGAYSLIFS